ncbi:MAG: hypothetical protein H7A08_04885 [Oceanospirillaceae bacterium]|nr:hypothetical protein [Oceanospirillaceae bacterium]
MNMVGELVVLVRNRLVRLGLQIADRSGQNRGQLPGCGHKSTVLAVKTRVQPIKKSMIVFRGCCDNA